MGQVAERQAAPHIVALQSAKAKFLDIAGEKKYDIEEVFAVQALMKNDYSLSVAKNNPQSVKLAMINVAATGLTLNPANAYAYLVPRDGAIVLDISYKGLIKIATDTGAVMWARADIVYAEDDFAYKGPAEKPEHSGNPFGDRGEIVGAYCIAKTKDGDILTEVMSKAELDKVRDKSMAWAKKKAGPWKDWPGEMIKKTVIKRASKTWPYSEGIERLQSAIEIASESEGGYNLSITPAGGAWQECSEEEQEFLQGIANHVKELLPDTGGKIEPEDAIEAAQHIKDQNLNADEYVALWTRFTSRQRTALKKADEIIDTRNAA